MSEYAEGIRERLFERVNQAWDRDKMIAIYNDCAGERRAFRGAVKRHYKTYGLDPMTIIMLVQMAIRLYIWAKENGFLSKISDEDAMGCPGIKVLFDEASDTSEGHTLDEDKEYDDEN